MGQRQIDAAFRRSLKTVYKHLSPPQYRLVKAVEQIAQHDKSLTVVERTLKHYYGTDWRHDKEAQADHDYAFFFWLLEDSERLNKKIARLEAKYELNEGEVMRFHNRMNQAHSASMVGASSF